MEVHLLKSRRLLVAILVTMFALIPTSLFAQEIDFPLAQAPNSDGGAEEPQVLIGNICGAFGGISLHDEPDREFTVNVPGTPVAAYIYWSGRKRNALTGDDTLDVALNGGALQEITADVALNAQSDYEYGWFAYSYNALGLIQSGNNTLRVTGMDIAERHGVGLLVVYEDTTMCPYQQIDLFFGNDVLYHGWDNSSGPDTEMTCIDFPAPPEDIAIDFQMFVGGIADVTRSDAIWFATGNGAKPAQVIGEPSATALNEQLAGLSGDEFDNYDTFVQDPQPITVKTGDTWACFQIESPEPPNPGQAQGISGNWINLAVRTPLASIRIEPDSVNPVNVSHTFTVNVDSAIGFNSLVITPTISPPPDTQSDTCATPVINGGTATCTVTINHGLPALFTANAEATIATTGGMASVSTNATGNNSGPATKEYVAGPAIVIEKATNGEDADTPTGPLVPVGGDVTWTYVVTNTGNIVLNEVAVVDDQGVVVQCPKSTLEPDESMLCTAAIGVAVEGQYANIATVTGKSPDDRIVDDSDPSHYVGYIPAAVGDLVFADIDPMGSDEATINKGNGVQDEGERGIDGIIVQLYNSDDELIAQTTTADGGKYSFTDLPPGDYYLVFINPLDGGLWTVANTGDDDSIDSDVDGFLEVTVETGVEGDAIRTDILTLAPGDFDRTWDAGLVGLTTTGSSALGDRVWLDGDENGVQGDIGLEPGFEGVTVTLYRINEGETEGTLISTTVTDADGAYFFDGLDSGNYYVEYEIPAEHTASPQTIGDDNTMDSDPDPALGRTVTFYLPPNFTDRTRDAGLFQSPLSIDKTTEPEATMRMTFIPILTR